MRVTIADKRNPDNPAYYYAELTRRDITRYDNSALISCGLTVGEGYFKAASFERLRDLGRLTQISAETYNHSSCQSSCKLRGNSVCRW